MLLIGCLIILATSSLSACADPGGDGLEALIVAAEDLVAEVERAPSGVVDPRVLEAWTDRIGPALIMAVREDTRALGPARRADLAQRWARVRDTLVRRLDASPRP